MGGVPPKSSEDFFFNIGKLRDSQRLLQALTNAAYVEATHQKANKEKIAAKKEQQIRQMGLELANNSNQSNVSNSMMASSLNKLLMHDDY